MIYIFKFLKQSEQIQAFAERVAKAVELMPTVKAVKLFELSSLVIVLELTTGPKTPELEGQSAKVLGFGKYEEIITEMNEVLQSSAADNFITGSMVLPSSTRTIGIVIEQTSSKAIDVPRTRRYQKASK